MIAVDTSALMAILLQEPHGETCIEVLQQETEVMISAGALAECLIVAGRRNIAGQMAALVEELGFTVVPVSATTAAGVAQAYAKWGKGAHPAGLNFGACFAYALARDYGCSLLYLGDDFARMDISSATG